MPFRREERARIVVPGRGERGGVLGKANVCSLWKSRKSDEIGEISQVPCGRRKRRRRNKEASSNVRKAERKI